MTTGGDLRKRWRATLETYPCRACEAEPGQSCQTRNGKPRPPHDARAENQHRCPGCGIRLAADALPGDWCDLCTVKRQLMAERYRHPTLSRAEGRQP